ncbi:MAG: hypothetical protein MJ179_09280 [Treponema sp.]|nr:hypothetical protein [Treponema sp.]
MSDIFPEANEGKPDGKQPLHFFYNREERIAHAPQIVKDFYDGKMEPVRGIKVLFQKQNRYILIALVLFVAFVWMYTGFNSTRNYVKINNIVLEMQAFSYDGEVYTNIKVKTASGKALEKPEKIDAKVYYVNLDNQPVEVKDASLVYGGGEEYLRTKFTDYDIIRVDAIISVGDIEKELSTAVAR